MTAILTALSTAGVLKWILYAIAAIGGALGIWLHGKSTGATQQKAKSQGEVDAAVSKAMVSDQVAADAKADAEQAKSETAAVKVAADAKDTVQAIPDADLDAAGAKLGIVRSE